MLYALTGRGKSKMALFKLDSASLLIKQERNSTNVYIYAVSSYSVGLSRMLHDLTGSGKSKMTSIEQEGPISQLVDKIGTKFQRLYLCFQGLAIHWNNQKCCTT